VHEVGGFVIINQQDVRKLRHFAAADFAGHSG
jgi:hypothetical protein